MRKSMFVFAAAFALLAVAPLVAHHSFAAEYDSKKPVTLKGIVTKVEWMNPHVYFYMDVADEKGKITNWALEMGPPRLLENGGWKKSTGHVLCYVDPMWFTNHRWLLHHRKDLDIPPSDPA